ncbi:MAG TPA: TRAP transporter large permease [Geminicoccaceae bacterium]|nr:TRAP transporter large permease [Geminicoccaceae bacterium]
MTEGAVAGLLGFIGLFALIALRIPIALAMAVVGLAGTAYLSGYRILLFQLQDLAYAQFSIYDLSVVPLFILMGSFATRAGLSVDLFRGANAWLGRLRGGVAMAAIGACAGFGAVCGSSLATASAMGQVALPELRRLNYAPSLATGVLAAGGTLGILIPPSVVLVIYAVIVEANIVTMFMAAFIPGLLAVLFFMVTIGIYVRLFPDSGPVGDPVGRDELIGATARLLPVLAIFGLVIGGIYFGFFNPTPAAAIGALLVGAYGFGLNAAFGGRLNLAGVRDALLETAVTTAMIYLVLFGAELLKIFITRSGLPMLTVDAIVGSGLSPLTVLVVILAVFILLGCIMDSLSMIILAVPFFWPILAGMDFGLGQDELKIWFGILALIVVELGLITPPVGLNVFIINAMARDVPIGETFKGVLPFFLAELVRVALLVAFPSIVLFLPRLLG